MNLVEGAKKQIDMLIYSAYEKARSAGKLPEGALLSGSIEIPREVTHGDYAATHALAAAKELKLPPRKIAEIIVDFIDFADVVVNTA